MHPDGSNVRPLKNMGGDYDPAWSPDGAKLAFLRSISDGELWVTNAHGTNARRLATDAGFSFSWAPGGRRIVYVCGLDICIVDTQTGTRRTLIDSTTGGAIATSWSPDGSLIAFATSGGVFATPDGQTQTNPASDLFVVELDGEGLRRLTNSSGSVYEVAWAPDSRRLAFVREAETCNSDDANFATNIFVIRADGIRERAITNEVAVHNTQPEWARDGRSLVYARLFEGECHLDGDSDIYLVRPDGSGRRPLTTDKRCCQQDPTWSPNGRWVVYVDGTSLVKVTRRGTPSVLRTWQKRAPSSPDWQRA